MLLKYVDGGWGETYISFYERGVGNEKIASSLLE
jgi:hypothetical protein